MRLNRNSLIFIVILIVIIAGAWFFLQNDSDSPDDANASATSEPQTLYPDLTADSITALSVSRSLNESDTTVTAETLLSPMSISLVRTDGGTWILPSQAESSAEATPESTEEVSAEATEEPSEVPATPREIEQSRLTSGLRSLLGLRVTDSFESDDLSQFGLDNPAFTVNFAAGDESYQLQIGNKNISGSQYYALVDDKPEVHLLSSASSIDTVTNLLSNPPYVVPPEPTPIPVLNAPGPIFTGFDAQSITSFSIQNTETDEELNLVRDSETGEWSMVGSEQPAMGGLIDLVLSQFVAINAVDKVPAGNLEAIGLENPSIFIIAGVGDDANHIIALGDKDPTGTRYYARVNAYEDVAILESEVIDFILEMLDNPPVEPIPEATAEATAESTESAVEATAEATESAGD